MNNFLNLLQKIICVLIIISVLCYLPVLEFTFVAGIMAPPFILVPIILIVFGGYLVYGSYLGLVSNKDATVNTLIAHIILLVCVATPLTYFNPFVLSGFSMFTVNSGFNY